MTTKRKFSYLALVVSICVATYTWSLWLYGGLYQSGRLLPVSEISLDTFVPTLVQNTLVLLPELLAAILALALLGRRRFTEEMGLHVQSSKKPALALAAGTCLLALAAALLFASSEPLAIGYRWVYDLVFVAFSEELTFRGLLPFLTERSGVPVWAVWAFPGVLFACMHTLMIMVRNGFTVGSFLWSALTMLGGYTAGHCGFYALRRWSGTLWLPVLVHGTLDFLAVFTK